MTTLTPRQLEILALVAEGWENKQIAGKLGIKRQSIKNHMKNIMDVLDAHDRTHAVVLAHRKGLLRLGCWES